MPDRKSVGLFSTLRGWALSAFTKGEDKPNAKVISKAYSDITKGSQDSASSSGGVDARNMMGLLGTFKAGFQGNVGSNREVGNTSLELVRADFLESVRRRPIMLRMFLNFIRR